MADKKQVVISAPKFETLQCLIEGTAPLVVERFSKKAEMMAKMQEGSKAKNKKVREARDFEKDAQESKHISEEGWEGFHAGAIRAGMISACKLVDFKMTMAKLSVFVEQDGLDKEEGVPLIRIYGKAETHTAHTRNATGVIDIRSRPMYRRWSSLLRIKYDADQFGATEIINLLSRVGTQIGICAGRPDSKRSAGCGWGTFRVVPDDEVENVIEKFGIK